MYNRTVIFHLSDGRRIAISIAMMLTLAQTALGLLRAAQRNRAGQQPQEAQQRRDGSSQQHWKTAI
jgi:hypothetical protein